MEREQEGEETAEPLPNPLFPVASSEPPLPSPLFPVASTEPPLPSPIFPFAASELQPSENASASGWLRNVSFTADLSVIDEKASALRVELDRRRASSSDDDEDEEAVKGDPPTSAYELIPEDGEEREEERGSGGSDSDREERRKRKRRKKQRKVSGGGHHSSSRKSSVRDWADSYTRPTKDYYLDTHGDRDNLVYGSLYRANVPRYRSGNVSKVSSFDPRGLYRFDKKGSLLNRDADVDALDNQIRSGGRYWSAKYVAVERHKNLKRLRFLVPKQPAVVASDDFIPLSDNGMPGEGGHCASFPAASIIEESWEDEVLRKTREFNRFTREHPHDEKLWLEFAEFQDKVASKQPQKGARLQTLEKKISILENAVKLNPESEDLLIYLLKAHQSKDSTDVLNDRWEKVLMHHSGSYRLWKEYLGVFQGEFSRFKVSDMRKMYSHAIQALSAMRNKLCRQDPLNPQALSLDSTALQLELALVEVFFNLCQFEWQAGYQELATSLIQAEIEFSLFCPSLNLSERSKLRLFEHFWNNGGPRIGEEEAVGWSSWLEKEEENRQRIVKEQSSQDDDKGGWTSWSVPSSKRKEDDGSLENLTNQVAAEELQEELEDEDANQEDDTEALLKQLGIDVDASAETEIKDPATWTRWSKEELSRDYNQWMPVHPKSDGYRIDGNNEETSLGEILFEDVCDYLFSLSSREAQLSLLSQLVDFFGGEMSQRICTNSSSWSEKILNLDALPNSIIKTLRDIDGILLKSESSSRGICDEFLFSPKNDHSNRADMMKFLRNALLLCLREFPRNYVLEEAVLVAEERSVTKMNSSAAFRPLAKSLLKSDRQDMLLCGVYAKREALAGNIDYARRAFDMALSSFDGLSLELRSNAPLLYLWYAEAELANTSGGSDESSSRILHILSSLGSGTKYSPYECKPSNLQLLRAHQGFKEKLRMVQSAWVRGSVDDQSIALVCSASLFEELATGWTAGIKVLDEAFNMVLPERRSNDRQLEFLFNYYVRMLLRHQKQSGLPKVWKSVLKGLQIYPFSSELLKNLLEVSHLCTTSNKVRLMFDDHFHRKPSIIVCVFALLFEMRREGSVHRIHGLFEKALTHERLRNSVILWRMYLAYEIGVACNPQAARRVFYRAIHACPWSKKLWLDGFLKLSSVLTAKELSDLQEVMRDKELNLRTDIYEILLQEDIV